MKKVALAELATFMEADEVQVEMWDAALIDYLANNRDAMHGFRFGSYQEKSRIWHGCLISISNDRA